MAIFEDFDIDPLTEEEKQALKKKSDMKKMEEVKRDIQEKTNVKIYESEERIALRMKERRDGKPVIENRHNIEGNCVKSSKFGHA